MHLGARMRQLRAERERVRVPDDLGDREGDDVADVPALRGRTGGHPRQEHRVLGRTEVLRQVLGRVRPGRLLEQHVRVLAPQAPCRRSRTTSRRSSCSPATRGSEPSARTACRRRCSPCRSSAPCCRASSGRTAVPSSCACDQPPSLCRPDVDPGHLVRRRAMRSPTPRPTRQAPMPRPRAPARRPSISSRSSCSFLVRSAIPKGIATIWDRRLGD